MIWQAPEIWDENDCFIIGGGHSIAKIFNVPDDLVPLRKEDFLEFGAYLKPFLEDKRVIGVNLSAFLGDWVDVAYWGDSDTYLQYKSWYDAYGGLKVASAGKFSAPKYTSIKHLEKNHSKGLCTDRKSLTWAGFNSGAAAINLAYYLGAKRVFLLGFDMYSLPDGRVHWHAGYPDKKENFTNKDAQMGKVPKRTKTQPPYKRQIYGFEKISQAAQKAGLDIINLSPKSKIKEFPIHSFWDYFDDEGNKINVPKIKESIQVDTQVPQIVESENLVTKSEPKKVNFVCVLKSGGDYDSDYVFKLYNAIERNYSKEFNFYCLTDTPLNHEFINEIPLIHNWDGWWSKIELFRPELFHDFSIYFDLDTVILDNIDEFVDSLKDISFGGLRGFNQAGRLKTNNQNFASGIMVGKFGTRDQIYSEFVKDPGHYMHKYSSVAMNWKRGDQGMIADVLDEKKITKIQDYLPENYVVGKRATHTGKERVPNSHILAWSGKPRLHNINQGWIFDEWTG